MSVNIETVAGAVLVRDIDAATYADDDAIRTLASAAFADADLCARHNIPPTHPESHVDILLRTPTEVMVAVHNDRNAMVKVTANNSAMIHYDGDTVVLYMTLGGHSSFDIESLANCKWMRSIVITDNHFHHCIPNFMQHWTRLETLGVSWCSLTHVPDFVGTFAQLQTLNVCRTRIKTLPDSLKRCSRLSVLNCSHCYALETLPESLCECGELATLRLAGCGALVALPLRLLKCTKLTTLTTESCRDTVQVDGKQLMSVLKTRRSR
jgi:hypothetical protein